MQWKVDTRLKDSCGIITVTPVKDILEHEDYSINCDCEPKVIERDGGRIIVHNAFDGRHLIEQVQGILNENQDERRN